MESVDVHDAAGDGAIVNGALSSKEKIMKSHAILGLLSLAVCFGCVSRQEPETVSPKQTAQIPKQQELLWRMSENGKYVVRIVKYDPVEKIVALSRHDADDVMETLNLSTLPPALSGKRTFPLQFDGTNWNALWSP